ncbi:protein NLRC3-like [Arapaima gigas]
MEMILSCRVVGEEETELKCGQADSSAMSVHEELVDWDAASQSVSLDIEDDLSDLDEGSPDEDVYLNLGMEFGRGASGMNSPHGLEYVQAMDTTIFREMEQGGAASEMSFTHEFEDGPPGRSRSPRTDEASNSVLHDRIWQMRTPSPAPSYTSMESEEDSEPQAPKINQESGTNTRVQLERPDSPASTSYSFDSDDSTEPVKQTLRPHIQRQKIETAPPLLPQLKDLLGPNQKRHPAMTISFMFKSLQSALARLVQEELVLFKRNLRKRYPECFKTTLDDLDLLNLVDKILECCGLEGSLKITLQTLSDMKLNEAADYLQELCKRNEAQYDLKSNQSILRGILTPVATNVEETVRYIRDRMQKRPDSEKSKRLSLCLEELQS